MSGFHNIYRPKKLSRIVGNKRAVTQLQGIIKSGKFPSAILFSGPPGVGKTTMARAFINEILSEDHATENVTEVNFGSERSIDEVRALVQLSRLRPTPGASRRFVIGDEVHQLVSNKTAADAFLKPLEEPVKTTTFLLCSMEPEKFSNSTTGKALLSRCLNISLEKPTHEDLVIQAKRIIKAEDMPYLSDEESLDALVGQSDSSMRVLANNLELVKGYAEGLEKTPKKLGVEALGEALASASTSDDILAARFLTAVYARKYIAAHKEILEVADALGFINKVLWMNWFIQNMVALKGARHPKVYSNSAGWGLFKNLGVAFGDISRENQIVITAETNAALVALKFGSGAFAVDERIALAGTIWTLISRLKNLVKTGD